MSSLVLQGQQNTNNVVVASAARTTSSNSATLGGYGPANDLACLLAVTAASGTSPTLDVFLEDTVDGVNFFTVATFTQATGVTASVQRVAGDVTAFTDRLRVRWTIGGTTPSFTFSVQIFAKGLGKAQ